MPSTITSPGLGHTTVTSTRLADGRELHYFDAEAGPAPDRPVVDRRALPARSASGGIRYDTLTGEWVAVAAHRRAAPICPRPMNVPCAPAPRTEPRKFRRRTMKLLYSRTGSPRLDLPSTQLLTPRPGEPVELPEAAAKSLRLLRTTMGRSRLLAPAISGP